VHGHYGQEHAYVNIVAVETSSLLREELKIYQIFGTWYTSQYLISHRLNDSWNVIFAQFPKFYYGIAYAI